MSLLRASMTVGPPAGNAGGGLLRWAAAEELLEPVHALLAILHAASARTNLLTVVLHRLVSAAPLMNAWAADEAELYGLAGLASRLKGSPALLQELKGRQQPPASDILRYFPGQAESHYLFACWSARTSSRASSRPWVDALRVWLLAQALRCADSRTGALRDHFVAEVSMRLRTASEENGPYPWLEKIELLRPVDPARWHALQRHLASTSEQLAKSAPDQDTRRLFRAVGALAQGGSKPMDLMLTEEQSFTTVDIIRRARDIADIPDLPVRTASSADHEEEETLPTAVPVILRQDAEEDEDLGVVQIAVDPEQGVAEQELRGRYIQLLSGADARFLAWDWYCLTPPERSALDRLVDRSLGSGGPIDLLASLVWIALRTGRSLGMTEGLHLKPPSSASDPNADWTIDLHAGRLQRPPPRRAGHWTPSDSAERAVYASADVLALPLDRRVAKILATASSATPLAPTLGDLWPSSAPELLRPAFRRWIVSDADLRRLTQGMLSQVLGRQALNTTHDHVLTRLLTAPPDAGLPASTAYTAYRAGDPSVVGLGILNNTGAGLNLAGSRLDPVAGLLQDGFRNARAEVARLAGRDSAIEYHNAVAQYWDAVLRAATGIRPHADRWLDYGDVDEELEFVVIDDKPGLSGRRTRLVPLPTGLLKRFRGSYLNGHLPLLRDWLTHVGVGEDDLAPHRRSPADRSFLFLLVEQGGGLVEIPVSQVEPAEALRPEGLLPRRVFRHWLRTELHRHRADTEVVDSCFGHLDGATATHGDYSTRVWIDDVVQIRPQLDAAFRSLDAGDPPRVDSFAHFKPPKAGPLDSMTSRIAAQSRRTSGPAWSTRMAAGRSAALILSQELPGPPPAPGCRLHLVELVHRLAQVRSPEVMDHLGKRLMLTHKNTPVTLGPMRYGLLVRLIERAWDQYGQRPPMRRRFFARPRDDSPFDRSASRALDRRALAIDSFRRAMHGFVPSKVSISLATWIGAIDVILSSRCTDPQLRRRIVANHGFRVATFSGSCFLEWNASGEIDALDSPIQRLQISSLAAFATTKLLHQGQGRVGDDTLLEPALADFAFTVVGATSRVSFAELLDALAETTDQCNAIELPGVAAAYLAGRVRSTSLHWGDWLALRGERRRDVRSLQLDFPPRDRKPKDKAAPAQAEAGPAAQTDTGSACETEPIQPAKAAPDKPGAAARLVSRTDQSDVAAEVDSAPGARPVAGKSTTSIEAQQAARRFFKAIRAELAWEKPPAPPPGDSKRSASEASYRRDIKRAIDQLCAKPSGSVPSAAILLGQWAASLLDRKYAGSLIRLSTVRRYFAALSPRFEAAGVMADLLSMESEEIEDFYLLVIGLRMKSRQLYPARRLREFHRFAQREFALPEIDWSEISPDDEEQLCAPGFIDEEMFRWLLITLARGGLFASADERLAAQGIAILAYRAGLRVSEASGMLVDDLYRNPALAWVAVDKNRLRGLKTLAARRTVPMPHLRAREHLILGRLVDAARVASRGVRGAQHLFTTAMSSGEKVNLEAVKVGINAAIKMVTSQQHLSTHHLRHSFANRLFIDFDGVRLLPQRLAACSAAAQASCDVAELPGPTSPSTRRSVWAQSRQIGHAHVRTTFFSYVHLLGDLADALAFREVVDTWRPPAIELCLDLNELPVATRPTRGARLPMPELEAGHVLSMLCDLAGGAAPILLPGRYPIRHPDAVRLARVLATVETQLRADDILDDASDQSSESSAPTSNKRRVKPLASQPLRPSAPVATGARNSRRVNVAAQLPPPAADALLTAGAQSFSQKVPLAQRGLLSHVLWARSAFLRDQIKRLYAQDLRRELATLSITEAEFVGMFGSRRNISLYRVAQFDLVRKVLQALGLGSLAVRIGLPRQLSAAVTTRATRCGWLTKDATGAWVAALPGATIDAGVIQDAVAFQGEAVRHRIVISVEPTAEGIQSRWQLSLLLIALVPLLTFQAERE